MPRYTHVTLKKRRRIRVLLDTGYSLANIATRLGWHRSTVYRELKRNHKGKAYYPYQANQLANARHRHPCLKIRYDTALYDYILNRLKQGWRPEQISGRLKHQKKPYYVCHETIYHYIYQQRNKGLYYFLTRKKPKRGKRYGRKVGSGKFAGIRRINARPDEAATRVSIGHWEGDTIGFATSKYENITTLVERKSRYLCLRKNANRQSTPVMTVISRLIEQMPRKLWKTVTFDQGSEFAHYKGLERQTSCLIYYCNPHSPWHVTNKLVDRIK